MLHQIKAGARQFVERLRQIRQLVYKDKWSTKTVCRMRHLVYSFYTYDIWLKKMLKYNYS